jgi:hypothetical protein
MEDFDEAFGRENEGAFKTVAAAPEIGTESGEGQPKPSFAAPTPGAQKPTETKMSLSEMMKARNENPEANIDL